jgi:hypothetical protein
MAGGQDGSDTALRRTAALALAANAARGQPPRARGEGKS